LAGALLASAKEATNSLKGATNHNASHKALQRGSIFPPNCGQQSIEKAPVCQMKRREKERKTWLLARYSSAEIPTCSASATQCRGCGT
jgi:hypothetical protein